MGETAVATGLEKLKTYGDAHDHQHWQKDPPRPDYVAEMHLTAENVPALIEIARRWVTPEW